MNISARQFQQKNFVDLVLQAIEAASSALKTTTVLITHNVSIAAMGDRVISFTNGHIADIRLNAQRRPAGELSW